MPKRIALDGNAAMAEGVRLSRVQVVAAYPITPQTPIVERVADFINEKKLDARYIAVESEHSALSAVVGAALVGTRVFTATAGAGLALMHEIVGVASGNRLPFVMGIANRALPSPWSLQTDHSDSMSERDSGWIQLYAENCQEAMDIVILGYKLAEEVRLPVMVCIDGFFLTHATEAVIVPEQDQVDKFLPPYKREGICLDTKNPITINQLTSADVFTEIKHQHKEALDRALEVFPYVAADFEKHLERHYAPVEAEECKDADVVLVGLGSCCGTAKKVTRDLRAKGIKVGTLKITSFRPFPKEMVCEALKSARSVAVIDRSWGLGSEGPLSLEVKSALYNLKDKPEVFDFVAGLGGRDLSEDTIHNIVDMSLMLLKNNEKLSKPVWIDLKEVR